MKKALPIFFIVLIGLLVGGAVVWFLKPPSSEEKKEASTARTTKEEKVESELPLEERPYVALTPGSSCEYTLDIKGIKGSPSQLEYEVVYKVDSGITQGVPGTIKLAGKSSVARDLLFGTESSGNRRCDKGVKEGKITIKYRDDGGKTIGKVESDFRVYESAKAIKLDDFNFDLGKISTGKYIVMSTIGLPGNPPAGGAGRVTAGPVGVFGGPGKVSGQVTLPGEGMLYNWDGTKWTKLADNKTSSLGTFIKIASE